MNAINVLENVFGKKILKEELPQNAQQPQDPTQQMAILQKSLADINVKITDQMAQKTSLTKKMTETQDANEKGGIMKQMEGINDQISALNASKQGVSAQIASLQKSIQAQAVAQQMAPKTTTTGTKVPATPPVTPPVA